MGHGYSIKYFFFLLFLWTNCSLFAQTKFANSIRLTKDDGLPNNNIRTFAQSDDGFIWIGSSGGLSRYDGSKFKNYRSNPKRSNTLVDNSVNTILPVKDKVWISTGRGISVLDIHTDTFTSYIYNRNGERQDSMPSQHLQMTKLYKDKAGVIWCGTKGLGFGRYNEDKDEFDFFRYSGKKHLNILKEPSFVNNILSIQENMLNDSIMWFGTTHGLLEFNKHTENVEWLFFQQEDKTLENSQNTFLRIYQHNNGLLYTGNWDGEINVLDPQQRTITSLSNKGKPIPFSVTFNIRKKSDSEFWVSSTDGLFAYDLNKEEFTLSYTNDIRFNKFYGAHLVDDKNRFWSAHFNGVYCYDPLIQQFAHHSYLHLNRGRWGFGRKIISTNADQELIVCAQNSSGFFQLDRKTNTWTEIPVPQKYFSENGTGLANLNMVKSPSGDYTVNNKTGLYSFNPVTKQVKEFPFDPQLAYDDIRYVLWDSKERLWIGTIGDGLIRWDSKAGVSVNYQLGLDAEGEGYAATRIDRLFEDSQNNIWIKRDKGFSIYQASKDTILNFLKPERNHFASGNYFAEDRNGKVWVSGRGGNILFFDAKNLEQGIIKQINLKDYNSAIGWIGGMKANSKGDIWLLTNWNVVKVNVDNLDCSLYNYSYGTKRDLEFFSFDILPNDEVAIGLRGSILLLDAKNPQINEELAEPYLLGINVLDKKMVLDSSELSIKSIKLKYWENFFSFDFSAKGFTLAHRIKYRYRLKNFKDEWVDAGNRRNVNYTNVPGGDYVFQIQAANNEGTWNEKVYELSVSVGIPWWQSWWARLAGLLIISGIAYLIYRSRIIQIRKEERLKSNFERHLANVKMNALRAQMNPHFLFNCLNSIDSYIIKNETRKASEYLNKFARLIRLILQNSRTNYVNLKDELESLELYMNMEKLRFRNKFDYEIKIEKSVDVNNMDIPPMLIQPYIENAIWHGLMHVSDEHKGKVELKIDQQNGTLNCIIEDNGIGREKSAEIKSKKKNSYKKSMGMRITQDRIEMINKLYDSNTSVEIIDLKNEKGMATGTRVELNIPF